MKTLYIAEDEAPIRKIYTVILRDLPLEIHIFQCGSDFLAAVTEDTPDMVLLDYDLPDISGVALLRKVREIQAPRVCPVVFVTAKGMKDIHAEIEDERPDGIFVKPFSPTILKMRLQEIIPA